MSTSVVSPKRNLPPGSMGLPYIGERPRILDLEYLVAQYQKHGPIFKTRTLGRNIVIMMGREANRFLLGHGMKHFSWRDGWPPTFKELLGESLFVQDGDEHKQKRRLIMPAFHRQALHHYKQSMENLTQTYIQRWENLGTFEWAVENKQLTFEIASKLLMGSEPGAMVERLSQDFTTITNGFITVPVRWSWTPYGKALKARDRLLYHIEQAVRHRQEHPTNDALGLLVQTRDEDGNSLTMEELKAQSLLLLFAGHETTAAMLTCLVMRLAQHPDVWEQLRAEQEQLNIIGDLEMEHFNQMPYLEQVLKEVERLHPPVPAGFRGVVEPFEFNGCYVPKGWIALYPINVTHRDERVYTNPDTFDPDRFSPERDEGNLPYSLVGFGGGSRICIGYAFAKLEMKIIASYLLRFYDWELLPNQNLHLAYRPTITPKDGLKIRFWRRQI